MTRQESNAINIARFILVVGTSVPLKRDTSVFKNINNNL